jgi:long-chain acyl-CoA synthetase
MDRYDPGTALRMLSEHRITSWSCVPTMLNRIRALPDDELAAADLSALKHITVGGGPSPGGLLEWAISYFGPVIEHGYGASEVSGISSMPAERLRQKPLSVGRPFRHVQVRIVDKDGHVLSPNTIGDIEVWTPRSIRNYVGRDQAEEVQPDGFFRLGDLAYIDEDGDIFVTGRSKDMIIAGGVNIYPAEIESALVQHPDILDAAVFGIPHHDFGEQVAAYCEVSPGHTEPTREVVLEFLRDKLAAYKQPRVLEFVDELPRNTMGKILKRVLSEPYWQGSHDSRTIYEESKQ